jgi:long-chain acyl-CoA synthetase
MLEQIAARFVRRPALIYFGARISYTQLLRHVNRCAAGLQALGIKKGERIALMMANCPQFVIAYFGALRAGAIVTATSSMYTSREAVHQWQDAGVSLVVAEVKSLEVVEEACRQVTSIKTVIRIGLRDYYPKKFAALDRTLRVHAPKQSSVRRSVLAKPSTFRLQPSTFSLISWRDLLCLGREPSPVRLKPSDIACLQYTGGTTGTSKAAMLTHANLLLNAGQTRHWLGPHGQHDIFLAALPLFHIYAMTCVMLSALLAGASLLILPRFQLGSVLQAFRKYRPTVFHGVPTMFVSFNNVPRIGKYGFKSLRLCMSGGAPLPAEVQQNFEKLSGARVVEGYGLTEASPVTHVNPPDGRIKSGSIGLPIPGTAAKIVDLETGTRELAVGEVGELIVRGPQIMKGYWQRPQETAAVLRNGWLYTGDIARMDEDGYFYIVDRKKDMIIASGYNVYPRDVEEVLFEHPKIKEAAVIGVPHQYRGETIRAFVVLEPESTSSPEEIIAWCRGRMAPYKIPREVQFCDSLPKSAVGKYLRRELRSRALTTQHAASFA